MTRVFRAFDNQNGLNGGAFVADVLDGTGVVTENRTDLIYCPDENGIYQPFTSGQVGKYYRAGLWWAYIGPALTNDALNSNDLTQATWFKVNLTATRDQPGLDGTPNTGTRLTATAGNGGILDGGTTAASADQTTKWFVKRLTGTGTIELTVDNAISYVDITSELNTSDFIEVFASKAALANPVIGLRIVTSGDEVIVGNAELHTATEADIRGGTPIFTAGVGASVVSSEGIFDNANYPTVTEGALYAETLFLGGAGSNVVHPDVSIDSGAADYALGQRASDVRATGQFNAGSTRPGPSGVYVADTLYQIASVYGDGEIKVNMDGVYDTTAFTFTNTVAVTQFGYMLNGGRPLYPKLIRNIRRYELDYTASQAKIDDLMAGIEDSDLSAIPGHVNDLYRAFLNARGFTTGNYNDDMYAFLGSLGYTGALPDRLQQWWDAGAPLI